MPPANREPEPTVALLLRARAGDKDAYDDLFTRTAARLQFYLRVRLGSVLRGHEDSRDLLQETYLAAHRAFASFEDRGEGAFVRWLCRIAENQIRARADYHGAAIRKPPQQVERVSAVLDRITAGASGPATMADRDEQRSRLAEALTSLPHDERDALRMRHFEGREIAEIADALGTSETSARRLIGRATVRLGVLLEGGGER